MTERPNPFFSIVTAIYNAQEVVAATAESLRQQTFTDYEWIIVDGASTDGTLEAVRPYFIEGRDTLVSEPDRGVYDAMNKGLTLARGQVVQFLNAGDRLAGDDVLAKVAAEFSDGIDAIYGDTILSMEDGLTLRTPAINIADNLHRRMPISHQSLFTRRELHLRYPFDLSFRVSADYAVIAAMCKAGARMKYLPEPLNINSIEAEAISIAGKALSATEDYCIHRDILGRSPLQAGIPFLRKRVITSCVAVLKALPEPLYRALPRAIRRRLY